jgi:hypothetical protein
MPVRSSGKARTPSAPCAPSSAYASAPCALPPGFACLRSPARAPFSARLLAARSAAGSNAVLSAGAGRAAPTLPRAGILPQGSAFRPKPAGSLGNIESIGGGGRPESRQLGQAGAPSPGRSTRSEAGPSWRGRSRQLSIFGAGAAGVLPDFRTSPEEEGLADLRSLQSKRVSSFL